MIDQTGGSRAHLFVPDPATRPGSVRWALRLWLLSGLLLAALGVSAIVTTVLDAGWDFGLLAVAVLVLVVGLIYVSLSRKACRAQQWRGSLAALTCVVVVMLLVLTIGFGSPGLSTVLGAAVIGMIGSALAYRPDADAWFNGRDNGGLDNRGLDSGGDDLGGDDRGGDAE